MSCTTEGAFSSSVWGSRKVRPRPEYPPLSSSGMLGPKASAMHAELAATTGQSSLPHVFIQGKSVGGLYSANDVGEGLSALQKSGELATMLKAAGAL